MSLDDTPSVYASSIPRRPPVCLRSGKHMNRVQSPGVIVDRSREPGIHWRLVGGHRVYWAVKKDGEQLPGIRVPIGLETDDHVISSLAAALRQADADVEQQAADRLRPRGAASGRVLPFRLRPAPPTLPRPSR